MTMHYPQPPQPMGFGGRIKQFLGGPQALPFAAGLLGGGSNSRALSRGFGNAAQARYLSRGDEQEGRRADAAAEFYEQNNRPDLAALSRNGASQLASQIFRNSQKKAGDTGGYGTPIYTEGPDGVGVYQLPKGGGGEALSVQFPEGVVPTPGVSMQRLGTTVQPVSRSGNPTGTTLTIDTRGAASETAIGAAQGKFAAHSPVAVANADAMLEVIDGLMAHPGREKATGMSGLLDPRGYIRGTESSDYQLAAEQLEGAVFLEAFETLKGGGQITEIEGKKATAAKAQLARAQSDEQYLEALNKLRKIVMKGRDRAMRGGGVLNTSVAPAVGDPTVDDLLKKYGQ